MTQTDTRRRAREVLSEILADIPPSSIESDDHVLAAACRLSLKALSAESAARRQAPLSTWGPPASRRQKWMIHYEDPELGSAIYDADLYGDAQAEILARDQFDRSIGQWNCTLFTIAESHPVDVEALRTSLADLRGRIAISKSSDPSLAMAVAKADVALGAASAEDLPFRWVANLLASSQSSHLREIRSELDRQVDEERRERKYLEARPREDLDEETRLLYERVAHDKASRTAVLRRDLALAEAVSRRWSTMDSTLLVPIGTRVRVSHPEIMEGDWPLPKGGRIGVVTGYSTLRSRHNVVSFIGDVPMTDGEIWVGDEDRQVHFNYLSEELEVLSHGVVMDSDLVVDRPGWFPTHGHGTPGHILYSESMVVRSDGRMWRVQPCSAPPECTQVTTDDAAGRRRFDHLRPLPSP